MSVGPARIKPEASLFRSVQIDTHTYLQTAGHILQCSGTVTLFFLAARIVVSFNMGSFYFYSVCNVGRQISSPAKTETSPIKKETWNNTVSCGEPWAELLSKILVTTIVVKNLGHHYCCPVC